MKLHQQTISYEEYADHSDLNPEDLTLLNAAMAAVTTARPQFSHFQVGAAARLVDGSVFHSSNVENTSIMTCAEQNLLLHLHSLKQKFAIRSIAISFNNLNPGSRSDFPITPCGKCRQLLLEAEDLAATPMRIIMAGQSGKVYVVDGIRNLLPLAFDESFLAR
jgi:cytidine deaminase